MKRPYRSLDFNDERKWKSTGQLDDVLQVGKQKAVGYVLDNLNYSTKEFDIQVLAEELIATQKIVRLVTNQNNMTLWAGDHYMMAVILSQHRDFIQSAGWPTEPAPFLERLSVEQVDHEANPQLYHIICDLFNSWCLWCETPVPKKFADGSTRYLSKNPYDPDL